MTCSGSGQSVPRRPTRPGDGRRRPGRQSRAAAAGLAASVLLLAAGCGGSPGRIGVHGLRVTLLELTPTTGFPGPPTEVVTVQAGPSLERIARLVPAALPPPPAATPNGSTVCFPMDLRIGLSDGETVLYPSCNRPLALRRVLAALCPLLGRPRLCFRYRHELE
jgi:hypothetical protein